jgi:hypothetical protein
VTTPRDLDFVIELNRTWSGVVLSGDASGFVSSWDTPSLWELETKHVSSEDQFDD